MNHKEKNSMNDGKTYTDSSTEPQLNSESVINVLRSQKERRLFLFQ